MHLTARSNWGWGVIVGVPALFVVAYLWPMIPAFLRPGLCAVKRFSGFPCPGCGLRSSLSLLAHGELRGSIDAHPLGVLIALWLLYVAARAVFSLVMDRPLPALLSQGQRDLLLYVFVAALVLQWLAGLAISWIGT